jgi:hypothetical protein
MKSKFVLTIIFSILIYCSNAQWQQTNGPFGGEITSITSRGNYVFSGRFNDLFGACCSGFFLSSDNGITWHADNSGFIVDSIFMTNIIRE